MQTQLTVDTKSCLHAELILPFTTNNHLYHCVLGDSPFHNILHLLWINDFENILLCEFSISVEHSASLELCLAQAILQQDANKSHICIEQRKETSGTFFQNKETSRTKPHHESHGNLGCTLYHINTTASSINFHLLISSSFPVRQIKPVDANACMCANIFFSSSAQITHYPS